jgi:hypothetical protein
MNVRLVQIDGALPNIALMRLAHWHRSKGDYVYLTRHILPMLGEPQYDVVYGSSIFENLPGSAEKRYLFDTEWPNGIMGGTGIVSNRTIEQITGGEYEHYDYQDYPEFDASLGYTQRGCRMAYKGSICESFCKVPAKEGLPKDAWTIERIWRGDPWPKKIHLLDNDFFGGPHWKERIKELRDGKYKVCFSQGINTRLITQEHAEAMATVKYRNTQFNERKLYTAWDNVGDEGIFFRGVERLEKAGIPPKHLMVYMLIGSDILETWERIWHRFKRMVDLGIEPYPMVKDRNRKDLLCFQRWVVRGLYRIPEAAWPLYERETKTQASVDGWEKVYGSLSSATLSLHQSEANFKETGNAAFQRQ